MLEHGMHARSGVGTLLIAQVYGGLVAAQVMVVAAHQRTLAR